MREHALATINNISIVLVWNCYRRNILISVIIIRTAAFKFLQLIFVDKVCNKPVKQKELPRVKRPPFKIIYSLIFNMVGN